MPRHLIIFGLAGAACCAAPPLAIGPDAGNGGVRAIVAQPRPLHEHPHNAADRHDHSGCVEVPGSGLSACFAPGTDPDYANAVAAMLTGDGPPQYSMSTRWSFTATNGSTGAAGSPITLTYSFVPDYSTGDPTTSNVVHATFDAQFGSRATWKNLFRRMFDDWSAQTGITFLEVNDDGASWPGNSGSGSVRGDIRIVAWEMDGAYGVLAYNYYPNSGDMAIDKDEDWADAGDDYRFLRNTLMHELGHGLGLQHVLPRDGTKLMEAFLNTGFDGPQDDDVRGAMSYYGDPREPNAAAGSASDLGTLASASTFNSLALHAPSDVDWYGVSAAAGTSIVASATPVGSSYLIGPDPGTTTTIDTRAINALRLEVYNQTGATLLAAAPAVSAGQTATTAAVSVPGGESGLRVKLFTTGSTAQTQRYSLTLTPQGASSTYTLLVGSDTGGAVPVSFTPAAQGGATTAQTPTALVFAAGSSVSITAPTTFGGEAFMLWEIDGIAQATGQRTVSIAMNANRTARVVYGNELMVSTGGTQTVVAGESATLIATASGGSAPYAYQWSPSGSLSSATNATTVASPSATTTYTITVTDADGSTAIDDVTVQVLPALNVNAGADQTVPAGQTFTLTASASGGQSPYTYLWAPAVATADSLAGASLEASVGVTTTFTVTVTDSGGRTTSDSVVIAVPPAATVSAGMDQTVVTGEFALLSATAADGVAPYEYDWSPSGVALNASGQTVRVLPSGNTDYTVTVTDASGQQATDVVRVSLASTLLATAIASSSSIGPDDTTLLQVAASGGLQPYTYSWSPANTLSAPDGASTWAAPDETTTFTVIVTDALGQSAAATTRVVVTAVAGGAALDNFAPAVPSPCGFGFATAAPFMFLGTTALRRRR